MKIEEERASVGMVGQKVAQRERWKNGTCSWHRKELENLPEPASPKRTSPSGIRADPTALNITSATESEPLHRKGNTPFYFIKLHGFNNKSRWEREEAGRREGTKEPSSGRKRLTNTLSQFHS